MSRAPVCSVSACVVSPRVPSPRVYRADGVCVGVMAVSPGVGERGFSSMSYPGGSTERAVVLEVSQEVERACRPAQCPARLAGPRSGSSC